MTKHKIQNKSQSQMANNKTLVLVFAIVILNLFCALNFVICHLSFAEEQNKLVSLSKQIIEAKTNSELYPAFEELKDLYFSRPEIKSEGGIPPEAGKENKYSEFVEFLESLKAQKDTLGPFTDYYTALSRYRQLKHLEEVLGWDEYFSQGNTYRDQIASGAKKTIDSTTAKEALNVYARLLLWQFHSGQQDAFHEQALTDLINAALEYSKEAVDLKPLKDAATEISAYGEKGKAKELYKVYIDKLAGSPIKEGELSEMAAALYKENNLELAEFLYDAYIERAAKTTAKEELIPLLAAIARQFSYSLTGEKEEGLKDPFYSEKIFKRMEEAATGAGLGEELEYLRAFNLEKAKEYNQAKDVYLGFAGHFPKSAYAGEANYKAGIIYTYILRDVESGKCPFEKLSEETPAGPQAISSLYQLGLLSQWKEDFEKAKGYYDKLIAAAGSGFTQDVALANERLKEIAEARPMEYNLKTFLDVSLKEENIVLGDSKADLKASPWSANKNDPVAVICTPPAIASGCMEVAVQYLWSGKLGAAKPSSNEATFNTAYTENGTKEISLVVVSSAGVVDRSIVMADIR